MLPGESYQFLIMWKQQSDNDAMLMQGFREGKEQAFSELFGRLYAALVLYALRITGDQSVSEDIAEESFVKVWDRRAGFVHFNVVKSFLYTTVRNAGINWVKQQQRQGLALINIAGYLDPGTASPLEDLVAAETFRELYSALEFLPAQSGKIIRLIYLDGKKPGEVARELGISIAHVSTQKKRALLLLRKWLPPLSCLVFTLFIY
jgi:RNA polymerase sigma factor (sigma-70 family)